MTQAAEQEQTAQPLFHGMDGKPVHIGDSVELIDDVIDEVAGQIVTVDRANTPEDRIEELLLVMMGQKASDFFVSDSNEPGMAYPCYGVRKVEVQ